MHSSLRNEKRRKEETYDLLLLKTLRERKRRGREENSNKYDGVEREGPQIETGLGGGKGKIHQFTTSQGKNPRASSSLKKENSHPDLPAQMRRKTPP